MLNNSLPIIPKIEIKKKNIGFFLEMNINSFVDNKNIGLIHQTDY